MVLLVLELVKNYWVCFEFDVNCLGKFAFYTKIVSAVANFGASSSLIIDWYNANTNGYENFNNVFQDPRACSIPAFFNVAANKCERVNQNLLQLSPALVTADLEKFWLGYAILGVVGIIFIMDVISSIVLAGTGQADELAQEAQNIVKKANRTIKDGFELQSAYPISNPRPKQRAINIYEYINFSQLFSRGEQRYFHFLIVFAFIHFIMMFVYFGFFNAQAGTIPQKLFEVDGALVYSTWIRNGPAFIFYALIAMNMIPFFGSATSGDFFMNWISKWTGIFGIGLNIMCLIYGGIYCLLANQDGQGLNPANDFRFCSALVVGTGDAIYLNAANACTNNFLCPITLFITQLGVNGYMKYIMWYGSRLNSYF